MNIPAAPTAKPQRLDLDHHQEAGLSAVADLAAALNAAIARAVETGLTIEVTRLSRCHTAQRSWGDQIALSVDRAPAGHA